MGKGNVVQDNLVPSSTKEETRKGLLQELETYMHGEGGDGRGRGDLQAPGECMLDVTVG
jgi:hypothetical protein